MGSKSTLVADKASEKHRFELGCIGGARGWSLRINGWCSTPSTQPRPCPHCRALSIGDPEWRKRQEYADCFTQEEWEERPQFVVPRLVQDGQSSWCLDCVLEGCNSVGDMCLRLSPGEGAILRTHLRLTSADPVRAGVLENVMEKLKR